MSLPWDELKPEDNTPPPVPPTKPTEPDYAEPELEYVPKPEKRPDVESDLGQIIKDALNDALKQAGPKLRDTVKDYAKDTVGAVVSGQTVDVLHPTIVAETAAGHELIVADARSRSWRTLWQGLVIDVFFAIIAAVTMLTGTDPFIKETWITFGILLFKSVLSAIVAYFMRLKITPTMKTPGEKMAIMPVPRPMIEKEESA
jgi:hypothetical protein